MNVLSESESKLIDELKPPEFGPYCLADQQRGDEFNPDKIPVGYYLARMLCANCTEPIFLYIAKGFEVPAEAPDISCPNCGCQGHSYTPLSELIYTRLARQRFEEIQGEE